MEESKTSWGLIILLFLLFIMFGGNRGGIFGGCGIPAAGMADGWGEKQEIIDSARTQYLIEQKAAATQAIVQQTANVTQTKIDYYAYMDQRDKIAEQAAKIQQLENQIYSGAQFGALNARLDRMECCMLKRPPLWGQVVVPSGTLVPTETAPATGA